MILIKIRMTSGLRAPCDSSRAASSAVWHRRAAQISNLSVSAEIVASGNDSSPERSADILVGPRRAPEPEPTRMSALLCLRPCRAALYTGFQPADFEKARGMGIPPVCRLEVGDTAGWKPALRSAKSSELDAILLIERRFATSPPRWRTPLRHRAGYNPALQQTPLSTEAKAVSRLRLPPQSIKRVQ